MPKLEELCEFIIDCLHFTAPIEDEETGYYSIRTPDIGNGRLILNTANRVSEETYLQWTIRAVPEYGDLILAREAPVGNVAMVPLNTKVCLGQRTVHIRPDASKVHPFYLLYYLLTDQVQGRFHGFSAGVTVPHLNMKDIRNLPLPTFPDLLVQYHIASFLSAYEDLIENNNRRISLLEESIRLLYREWFVHLRYPGHESVLIVDGLPQRWERKLLKTIADVNEKNISRQPSLEEIEYIDISSVGTGSIDKKTIISFNNAPSRAQRIVQNDDIIWSTVRPNRRSFSFIINPNENTVVSTGFAVLSARQVPATFLYLLTTTDDFVNHLTNVATGAAYPAVKPKDFENSELVIPPKKLLDQFNDIAYPAIKQINNLQMQNEYLSKARDLLLPRLMNGDIEVS
jgi:type I restriction enzyme S subunit